MANRIVHNTYIIDTGSGNVELPWPTGARIASVNFWGSATNSLVRFAGSNTSDAVIVLSVPNTAISAAGYTVSLDLHGVQFPEMKVPTLTAGTAWIYFA